VEQGSTKDMIASDHPFVRQFIDGEQDGPVRFHAPARPLTEELGVTPA
jgi:phospholipid/cholesterol/gamma-HCH transport system ATP-binding protein